MVSLSSEQEQEHELCCRCMLFVSLTSFFEV